MMLRGLLEGAPGACRLSGWSRLQREIARVSLCAALSLAVSQTLIWVWP